MYDAKEFPDKNADSYSFKNGCVADRSYFFKVQRESMMNLKTSYVPREKVIEFE